MTDKMKRPHIVSPYLFDPNKYNGVKSELPSLTIPNDTLSLREILDRYAKGLPTTLKDNGRELYYDAEDTDDELDKVHMPDTGRLDYAERDELSKNAIDELNAIRKRRQRKPKPPTPPTPPTPPVPPAVPPAQQ